LATIGPSIGVQSSTAPRKAEGLVRSEGEKKRRIDGARTSVTAAASSNAAAGLEEQDSDLGEWIGFGDEDDWETGGLIKNQIGPEHAVWEVEPARKGAPGRKAYRIGSAKAVQALSSESVLDQALKNYDSEKLMESSRRSQMAHLKW
jgi:hypothetical protein